MTTRNRLRAAATRRGIGMNFRRTKGDLIRFQIVEHSNGNGAAESPVKPKNKGGRPKKEAEADKTSSAQHILDALTQATNTALEGIGLREPAKRKGGRPKKNP